MNFGISGLVSHFKTVLTFDQESSSPIQSMSTSGLKAVFSDISTDKKTLENTKITVLDVVSSLKKTLPQDEFIQIVETVDNVPPNLLYAIKTDRAVYALRSLEKDENFDKLTHGLGLEIVCANTTNRFVMQKPETTWPRYQENPKLYFRLMQKMRSLHESRTTKDCECQSIVPFDDLLEAIGILKKEMLPKAFTLACKQFQKIFDQLKPWLKQHATVSLISSPVFLLKKGESVEPQIRLLPYTQRSHPYYDIVEYSYALCSGRWDRLLQAYLNDNPPSDQQRAHGELLQYVYLLKQAVNYFQKAQDAPQDPHNDPFELRVHEMDELLDDFYPLLEKVEEDGTKRQYQRCALYYLNDFLSKTNSQFFTWLLENV